MTLKLYTADFETKTIEPAAVWSWGISSIDDPEECYFGESIDDFMLKCQDLKNPRLYFHNEKFDGGFIIDWLFQHGFEWRQEKKLCEDFTFTTIISGDGKFYSITIYFKKSKKKSVKVEIWDSLKLLNMPVAKIAKNFKLPILKGKIDYDRHNVPCEVTQKEWDYLKNDVQIMSMALHMLIPNGLDKMTVGACAFRDYKEFIGEKTFKRLFPVLTIEEDAKIRLAYRGGFTYCNPENQDIDQGEGIVLDVNSLYPYVMSACDLPYGTPLEFDGDYNPAWQSEYPLYILKFRAMFELKDGYIPTIQLKHSPYFSPTEYVTTTFDPVSGCHIETELCLTNVDLELFKEHYNVIYFEPMGGYMFKASNTLFSDWVTKWNMVKMDADKNGNRAMRQLAKLFMNNLYGKFGTNPMVKTKEPYWDAAHKMVKYRNLKYPVCDVFGDPVLDEHGVQKTVDFILKDPIYIPVAAFVTAQARNITIRTSQKIHMDSKLKTGHSRYCYSDTDSIHLLGLELPEGVNIHPRNLGAWKHESTFERARFIIAKRYIEDEYILTDEGHILKNGYGEPQTKLKITCSGMPPSCYKYVTWENFRIGAVFDGKKNLRTVQGGVILEDVPFKLKGK